MADEEKKEEEEVIEDEKPKGGSKKLLIIGLLAGLIFGGGGAAGFFIMQSGEEHAEPVEEVVEEIVIELPDYQYANLDRLQLPLFYKGRVLNYAIMDISIEVIGEDDKILVAKNILVIKDKLLRYYSVNSVGREDNPRIVDFAGLSEKIKEVANAELHKDVITRVVIGDSRNF